MKILTSIKSFLLKTPFFSGKVKPVYADTSHFLLGALFYHYLGGYALIIPLIKEWMDIMLWGGFKERTYYAKTIRDLLGWYAGMLFSKLMNF